MHTQTRARTQNTTTQHSTTVTRRLREKGTYSSDVGSGVQAGEGQRAVGLIAFSIYRMIDFTPLDIFQRLNNFKHVHCLTKLYIVYTRDR